MNILNGDVRLLVYPASAIAAAREVKRHTTEKNESNTVKTTKLDQVDDIVADEQNDMLT